MTKGRKRKANVKRVNGRISQRADDKQAQRSIEQKDIMAVAREARERVHGVAPVHSGTELAGSFVGRLFLRGDLRRQQLDAAFVFSAQYANYARALGLPMPPRAVDLSGMRSGAGRPITAAHVAQATALFDASKRCVQEANNVHRSGALYSALWFTIIMDQDLPHLSPDLRIALNALARHYRITEGVAA